MKRVAIIGAGTIAANHAKGLKAAGDIAQVVAVADINRDAAETLAKDFNTDTFTDYKQMLVESKPDIGLICLPHSLHLSAGLDVLNAGVNLFLEKPMALSVDECRKLMTAAESRGASIFVGQTHQYRANFRLAKKLITEGAIGEVRMIFDEIAAYYNYENRKAWFLDPKIAGGGPIFNTTPHQIDHLLYLVDSPVKAVRGGVESLRPGVAIDSDCFAFVEYESGAKAVVATFQGTKAEDPARIVCRVHGSKGSLYISAFSPEVILSTGDKREAIAAPDEKDPFELEWRECIAAIDEKREALSGAAYGASVVAVLEAMIKSSRTGAEVKPESFNLCNCC